ncbi:MAG: hypothetical protein WC852_06090 [Candidatus Nanoarchaeia archaeon]|jgi:hypothetical protein
MKIELSLTSAMLVALGMATANCDRGHETQTNLQSQPSSEFDCKRVNLGVAVNDENFLRAFSPEEGLDAYFCILPNSKYRLELIRTPTMYSEAPKGIELEIMPTEAGGK